MFLGRRQSVPSPIELLLLATQTIDIKQLQADVPMSEKSFLANWSLACDMIQALAASPPGKPELVDVVDRTSPGTIVRPMVATPYGPQPAEWCIGRAAEHLAAAIALARVGFAPKLRTDAPRICEFCGEQYDSVRPTQKVCGSECRKAHKARLGAQRYYGGAK